MLGWDPQVNLREGIGNLIKWYYAERDWAKDVLMP
jgi:dTDP-D-glucose 4,6-dehydratase